MWDPIILEIQSQKHQWTGEILLFMQAFWKKNYFFLNVLLNVVFTSGQCGLRLHLIRIYSSGSWFTLEMKTLWQQWTGSPCEPPATVSHDFIITGFICSWWNHVSLRTGGQADKMSPLTSVIAPLSSYFHTKFLTCTKFSTKIRAHKHDPRFRIIWSRLQCRLPFIDWVKLDCHLCLLLYTVLYIQDSQWGGIDLREWN